MKVKTLEIWRKHKKIHVIEQNLQSVAVLKCNPSTLDDISQTKLNIHIPFVKAGITQHMVIPTCIELKEKGTGTVVACYSSITKPFLLSLIIGVFCPIPVLAAGKISAYFILLFILFTIPFIFLINRIIYTTRDHLKELKI